MSEKKLTVAELMARAAEEGQGETPRPRRRRRRSLDEGGVSVAELTGSIPAVETKPAESRHSSVPLDTSEGESAETRGAERSGSHAVTETDTSAPGDAVPTTGGKPVPGESGEVRKVASGVDVEDAPATAETAPTEVPGKDVDPTPPGETPRPSADETVVLSIVTDEDPVRLTTGEFPKVTPRQVQEERAGVASVPSSPPSDAVDAARTPSVAVDGDGGPHTTEMVAVPAGAAPDATGTDDATTVTADTGSDSGRSPDEGESGQGKVSVAAVLGMILVGLVVGVALFFGFEKLWGHFNTALTAVLAIAVTGGIVGVVHALRTERDGLSMFLAGLAGLAVTFGPLLTA
ncbi:hypothetical protein OS125_08755 [Corynebacterium sp. P7003]|uniref:Uncharacterized protein n=1 Tax=Corynebacterium pygosceleis TaxID=2800406 RepID=A0ABT3WU98_9CORY|nr:hypothetical protein [Corynebacterium pygosceleis]MCX7445328.1 hypothetical protein [Corynebacterium pygosceleis]